MRAVLLASATATTSGGRRRRSPITHGSAFVAFERSKLALAPLIRSRRKYWLPRLDIPPRRWLPPVEFCRGRPRGRASRHSPNGRYGISPIPDSVRCCVDDVSSGGVSTTASLGGRSGTFESGFG